MSYVLCAIVIIGSFFHWLNHFLNSYILTLSTSQAPPTIPRRTNLITAFCVFMDLDYVSVHKNAVKYKQTPPPPLKKKN